MYKALLPLLFIIVFTTHVQAENTLVVDNYITIRNAEGYTVHDTLPYPTYTKTVQYGTIVITPTDYKNPFYDLLLSSKTNIHNRYNDVYINTMNTLGNYGTPALSTTYTTYNGFDVCDMVANQTNYTPEIWTRLLLIKTKIYTLAYSPSKINNEARAEYKALCNTLVITNCQPNAQFKRGNIDFSGTKSSLILVAVITGLLTLVWLAGRRWKKPVKAQGLQQ